MALFGMNQSAQGQPATGGLGGLGGLGGNPMPRTMSAYQMRGTPTTILIDAAGRLRRQVFGVHDDLVLGAELQTLLLEATQHASATPAEPSVSAEPEGGCVEQCEVGEAV